MKRKDTGRYESVSLGGERVRAFIPRPLPPAPPLGMDAGLQPQLESAVLALGRLDAVSTLLPDKALFQYSYVRKEAVLSSQIEGTQSSLSDLLLFELDEMPGVPQRDAGEVSRHVAALDHGLARLRGGFPLSNRLLREIHGVLLGGESAKTPGEFRRTQNWIGGTRPGNARFVPPPASSVADCMTMLERFLHVEDDGIPVLIRAALAHVQFETVHPFLDGNGRVGRILVSLQLCAAGMLRDPLLYLSLYFKEYRSEYYDLLDRVRRDGDWERWLAFFLTGVRTTAQAAATTAERLAAMFRRHREAVAACGRRAGSALRVLDALKARPMLSLPAIRSATGLSFPGASAAVALLEEKGVAREFTGKRRNRLFMYREYLSILSEGTEDPLP